MQKKCATCRKIFFKQPNRAPSSFKTAKFCSRGCKRLSAKSKAKVSKASLGRRHSDETKLKIAKSHLGIHLGVKNPNYGNRDEKSPAWKGDKVGYAGVHAWVKLKLGKPKKCEHCGKDNLSGIQIQWASKDHKYKRNLKQWLRLCSSCHKKYDKKHGFRRRINNKQK